MKNIFVILIFLFNIAMANTNYELKLYEQILPIIFKTKTLNVYADDKTKEILIHSKKIKLVKNCIDATLLIGNNFPNIPSSCLNKPIFGTTYRSFKKNSNYFGAFYWRKGRPQIRFKLDVIKKQKLNLSDNLRKYAK
jgi:hypothetical protein